MKSPDRPLVTVLFPIYQSERYLALALESLLAQTYDHFEILMLCDMPEKAPDRSLEIIASFPDPRIRTIVNRPKIGLIGCLNQGIDEARGELIARMDGDDISLPTRLAEQVAEMRKNPDIDFLGCSFQLIDSDGRSVGRPYIQPATHDLIAWGLCLYNPMVHPAMMMRKDALLRLNSYSAAAFRAEDYDLWCRAALHGRLGNVEKVLLKLRKHPENLNLQFLSANVAKADEVNLDYMCAYLGLPRETLRPQLLTSPAATDCAEFMRLFRTLWHVYRAGMRKTAGRPADTRWVLGLTLKRALQQVLRGLAIRLRGS